MRLINLHILHDSELVDYLRYLCEWLLSEQWLMYSLPQCPILFVVQQRKPQHLSGLLPRFLPRSGHRLLSILPQQLPHLPTHSHLHVAGRTPMPDIQAEHKTVQNPDRLIFLSGCVRPRLHTMRSPESSFLPALFFWLCAGLPKCLCPMSVIMPPVRDCFLGWRDWDCLPFLL